MRINTRIGVALCALCLLAFVAAADDIAVQGRAVRDRHEAAMVRVQAVMAFSLGGDMQEMPMDAPGTVIGDDGLTVTALSLVDPSALARSIAGGFGAPGLRDVDADVRSVKIILPDDTELDAEVVIRDSDLDLVFFRPAENLEAFGCVTVGEGPELQALDPVLMLSRMSDVARDTVSVEMVRISAVVERPRKFYIPGGGDLRNVLGCPAFAPDGEFIGINTLRAFGARGGMGQPSVMVRLVPAADIMEILEQIPPSGE